MGSRFDWVKDDRWDDEAQRAFHEKVGRSRDQRKRLGYVAGKARALAATGDPKRIEAAIGLLRQVTSEWDDAAARDAANGAVFRQWAKNAVVDQARIRRSQNRVEEACALYREALAREMGSPDYYVREYAELLLEQHETSEYPAVLDLLDASFRDRLDTFDMFRHELFRYSYVQALMCHELGRTADAAAFARAGLQAIASEDHGVGSRLKLGATGAADRELDELRKIADPHGHGF
jgi:hypothetical protein